MPPESCRGRMVRVPDSNRISTKRLQLSNWAQAVEGGIDSSHISFLHSRFESKTGPDAAMLATDRAMEQATGSAETARGAALDKSPRFWTSQRPFGMWVAARRNANEDAYYWRLTPFMLPSFTIIPGGDQPDRNLGGHVWVPMDDDHCWTFSFTEYGACAATRSAPATRTRHPRRSQERLGLGLGLSNAYLPVRNRYNNYQVDRDEQRTRTFTGLRGISEQDISIQAAIGRRSPRWLEHLGTTDKAIIEFRALLLRMCKDLMDGKEPEQPHNPAVYQVRSAAFNLPHDVPWEEGMVPFVQSRAGPSDRHLSLPAPSWRGSSAVETLRSDRHHVIYRPVLRQLVWRGRGQRGEVCTGAKSGGSSHGSSYPYAQRRRRGAVISMRRFRLLRRLGPSPRSRARPTWRTSPPRVAGAVHPAHP